jgi:hypothetical protein
MQLACAQPFKPEAELREVVSPLPAREVLLPSAECGTTVVTRPDGTTVSVPKQGRFVERCEKVEVVEGGVVISSFDRCGPPKWLGC